MTSDDQRSGRHHDLQALEEGLVDELSIIVAPVVLGGGKRFFEGFTKSLELEHLGVRQSPIATFRLPRKADLALCGRQSRASREEAAVLLEVPVAEELVDRSSPSVVGEP